MSKRLVVTDDAMIIREMIKEAATSDGWEIVGEASNGQEAIERFTELQPDVMTLDLVMPDYDGLHALRGVMSSDADAQVLVVSALDQRAILKEAITLGAADFISKPFDRGRLISTLNRLATVRNPS